MCYSTINITVLLKLHLEKKMQVEFSLARGVGEIGEAGLGGAMF